MPKPDTLTRELERAWLQSDHDLPRTPPRQQTELDRRVDQYLRELLGTDDLTPRTAAP